MAPPAKRRKTESKTEEITFDLSARQEYLTGFHKRKVQRAKQAQEAAEKRAREDRIAERKKIREERKADLERHVREVNALLRPNEQEKDTDNDNDDGDDVNGDEWQGIEDDNPSPIDHEAEYIDEDKYTTVTVETMDVSRDGLSKLGADLDEFAEQTQNTSMSIPQDTKKKATRVKSAADKQRSLQSKLSKKKRKNFKYESKVDRKVSRMKEKFKNSKQARARKAS